MGIDHVLSILGYKKKDHKRKDQYIEELQQQIATLENTIVLIQKGDYESLSEENQQIRDELHFLEIKKEQLLNSIQEETQKWEFIVTSKEEEEVKAAEITNMMRARVAALQREQNIKDNVSDYCLKVAPEDEADLKMLEELKLRLRKPRILSMLIWQTYFQKQLTTLCNQILGTKTVCGIYKITNQLDNYCYIGQSVDVAKRWAEHVKCGLGIDTPAGNKLYDAMQKNGIQHFSFELLEECPRASLNEKEREYINIYDSYNLGYNSNSGIRK